MKRFRSIILPMQGHSKSQLHWLYNTASNIEEKEISYLLLIINDLSEEYVNTIKDV